MAPMAEAPAGQGKTLLEKARMELRSGQSTNARRLAEEAFQGPYGVKEEAAAVLRTIDVEDLNQKSLESRRTFDAMVSAYNRKEYEQAKNLLAAVNRKFGLLRARNGNPVHAEHAARCSSGSSWKCSCPWWRPGFDHAVVAIGTR